MEAILLAAGQGKRFQGQLADLPKVLIEVGGEALLDRHLRAYEASGVGRATIVVGFAAERIRERVRTLGRGGQVSFVENPRFSEGSLYSLYCARERLRSGQACLLMDADVLYAPEMLGRLVDAPEPCSVLFDADFLDEEMKIGLRGGIAQALGKKLTAAGFDSLGRGPGFYRIGPEAGPALARILEEMVAAGQERLEYEDALNVLFRTHPFHPVPVGGLPWTEIDHAADLEKARTVIWPRLQSR